MTDRTAAPTTPDPLAAFTADELEAALDWLTDDVQQTPATAPPPVLALLEAFRIGRAHLTAAERVSYASLSAGDRAVALLSAYARSVA